jgi:hypothetical protein
MAQLPRPRLFVGGVKQDVYIVTHGTEREGKINPNRQILATADFLECCSVKGYELAPPVDTPQSVLERLGDLASLAHDISIGVPVQEVIRLSRDPLVRAWVGEAEEKGLVVKSRRRSNP